MRRLATLPRRPLAAVLATLLLVVAGAAPSHAQSAGGDASLTQAVAAFDARRYAAADSAFRSVHARDPRDATAMMYLGRLALLRGDDAAAAGWLERAVRADPGVAEYHHWLGRAWAQAALHAGLLRRARLAGRIRNAFERAVGLDPLDVDARMDLLRYYVTAPGIVGGSVRRAREQAEAIERLDPMWGHIARGIVAEKEGDDTRAEREYRAARAARADDPAPYYALGAMFQRAGRWADAHAEYERLRSSFPRETAVLYQIGRTASLSGERLDEGVRALSRYLQISTVEGTPLPASAHYRLGLIHERQGRPAEARRELERAAALEPERDDVKEALRRLR